MIPNAQSFALAPDGKRVAFVRGEFQDKESLLLTADVDGLHERELARGSRPDLLGHVAWSPDGRFMVCEVRRTEGFSGSRANVQLIEVLADSGSERPLTEKRWVEVGSIEWLPDGSALLINAEEQPGKGSQLWRLSYPGGEARQVTNDPNRYAGVSLTAGASALVTMRVEGGSKIWVAPDGNAAHAKPISREASLFDGLGGLAWTPDDKLLFTSNVNATPDIWMMEPDGSQRKQLTTDPHVDNAGSVTPDGRFILFGSDRTGQVNIWRMNLDGANQTRLTNDERNGSQDVSPDGKWLLYTSLEANQSRLYKMPFTGGQPTLLSDKHVYKAAISPDGKSIAMFYSDNTRSVPPAENRAAPV